MDTLRLFVLHRPEEAGKVTDSPCRQVPACPVYDGKRTMRHQSPFTLAVSPWNPILGLLLAAGGVLLIGAALTFTMSLATSSAPASTQREGRAAVARSARTAELPMRTWPRSPLGTASTRAEAGRDGFPRQRPMPGGASSIQEKDTEPDPGQLAAILRRAHLRNPLVVAAAEPRGEHANRKCPVCDVSSGRSDASID